MFELGRQMSTATLSPQRQSSTNTLSIT